MAYSKTTWVDRVVQYANRFTKSGETTTEVTLTANPGTVTQAGTPINATNLNKMEQGIADALPKDGSQAMTGSLRAPSLKVGSSEAFITTEKKLVVSFANGLANQKSDIALFPSGSGWLVLDISIQSNWAGINATGIITKRFYLGVSPTGGIHHNSSRYVDVGGLTPKYFAIGELTWDSTNACYRIKLISRSSYANTAYITVKAMTAGTSEAFIDNAYTTAVYTTDATVYPEPVVEMPATNMKGNLSTNLTTGSISSASGESGSISVVGLEGAGNAAFMTFIRNNNFAAQFGIDVDNKWKVGGFSMGAVAYEVWHDGRLRNNAGVLELYDSGAWKGVGGVKSVQRGVFSSGASGVVNIPINAVNLNKSVVILSNVDTAASGTTHNEVYLSSSTQLTLDNSGSNYWPKIRWQVVEHY